VHKSDTLVLLATKGVLSRPWCLIELLETSRKGIPVVILQMANSGFSFESATRFATNLEEEMEKLNPPGLALLRSKLGDEIDELKNAVTQSLQQNQAEPPLVFDSHAGDLGMVATMKDVIERMARTTGRKKLRCLGDTSGISTAKIASTRESAQAYTCSQCCSQPAAGCTFKAVSTNKAVVSQTYDDVFHAPDSQGVCLRRGNTVSCVKGSREKREDQVTNKESAIFVCCSREDAVHHARILRSGLSIRLGRGCALGGGPDTLSWLEQSDMFVVLLTRNITTDPICLLEIWSALEHDIPIVTISVAGSGYDYDEAAKTYGELGVALETLQPGSTSALESHLPSGVTIDDVGERLHTCLTAIIALPWSPMGSKNQLDATIHEIVSRMPKKKAWAKLSKATLGDGLKQGKTAAMWLQDSVRKRPPKMNIKDVVALAHAKNVLQERRTNCTVSAPSTPKSARRLTLRDVFILAKAQEIDGPNRRTSEGTPRSRRGSRNQTPTRGERRGSNGFDFLNGLRRGSNGVLDVVARRTAERKDRTRRVDDRLSGPRKSSPAIMNLRPSLGEPQPVSTV